MRSIFLLFFAFYAFGCAGAPFEAGCSDGTCGEPTTCPTREHACGATCRADDDATACGAACVACTTPPRGVARCRGGACDFDCEPGSARVEGACVAIEAPRLVAPISASRVTSARPTLAWSLASGSTGARVEVCRDAACAEVVATFDAEGGSATVPTELPFGAWFWRARGLAGASVGVATSATWELLVPFARGGATGVASGAFADFEGDGLADVAVGELGAGRPVTVVPGERDTPRSRVELTASGASFLGASLAVGDFDGDGRSDLALGELLADDAGNSARAGGRVLVHAGTPFGVSKTPTRALADPLGAGADFFGLSVAAPGDLDGDGYGDLVVGAGAHEQGRVVVFRGSSTGLDAAHPLVLTEPRSDLVEAFGLWVSPLGDVDADGLADFSAFERALASDGVVAPRVVVWLGRHLGDPRASIAFDAPASARAGFGAGVARAGDLNGDGYGDLAITTRPLAFGEPEGAGDGAYVHFGGAGGPRASNVLHVAADQGAMLELATAACALGDADGDGRDDLGLGVPRAPWDGAAFGAGALSIVAGEAPSASRTSLTIGAPGAHFGWTCSPAGDVDGDGREDFVVGAPAEGAGAAYVFFGASGAAPEAPGRRIAAPPGAKRFGVAVLGGS